MDKCAKHDEVMDRSFTELNDIKLKVQEMNIKMDGVVEFKDMVHKIIFGNGDPGLKAKMDVIINQVQKQWFLLGIILTAILTTVTLHFWKG